MINGTVAFDDLYVLSLPSFTWVQMWPSPSQPFFGGYGHHSLTCDIINGTQMIVMGGTYPSSDVCDSPNSFAQHNVDLGELNDSKAPWYIFRNDNPPYRVPSALTKIIGGTAKGAANVTRPFGNRTYDEYLFDKTYKAPQRYPTPVESPSSTATPKSGKGDGSDSKSILIAATVGSVGAGIMIGMMVFCALNHYRRRREIAQDTSGKITSIASSNDDASVEKDADLEAVNEVHADNMLEVPAQHREELWTDPVELPGWRSSRSELPDSGHGLHPNIGSQQVGIAI